MRRFVNRLDQTEFVRLLNQQFAAHSREGTFATAIVATFFATSRRLRVCNAGHPRPLLYRAGQGRWDFLDREESPGDRSAPRNTPLGIVALADYDEFDLEMDAGDCLLGYTDALIESRDADGETLGEAGLLRITRLLGSAHPRELIDALLKEIAERFPENLSEDDVTLLVVRANGAGVSYPLRDKLWAFVRLIGSLVRAINPRAERPPLPDLNLANIGGAILPALGRKWRAHRPGTRSPDRAG